jgi:hypothetical protein
VKYERNNGFDRWMELGCFEHMWILTEAHRVQNSFRKLGLNFSATLKAELET